MFERPTPYRTCQASLLGLLHERDGIQCQDFAASRHREDIALLAVSDGASSQGFTAAGARIAVHATLQTLEEHVAHWLCPDVAEDDIAGILSRAISSFIDAYKPQAQPAEAYACTLIALALDETTRTYIAVHIGDGAILAWGHAGMRLLSPPANIRAPGQPQLTATVTREHAARHMRVHRGQLAPLDAVALITDGLQGYLLHEDCRPAEGFAAIAPKFSALGSVVIDRPNHFLAQTLLPLRGGPSHGDDITAALCVPLYNGGNIPRYAPMEAFAHLVPVDMCQEPSVWSYPLSADSLPTPETYLTHSPCDAPAHKDDAPPPIRIRVLTRRQRIGTWLRAKLRLHPRMRLY